MTRLKGIIFDIKEGAIFDGPGIRQTVFLKGCPLRCSWCHNPEGLLSKKELMVSQNGCTNCGRCMEVCPKAEGIKGFYHPASCDACGLCVKACPQRIRRISGEEVTPEELAKRLMENAGYYALAGGGVTFSGGEPLMQADFVLETLSLLPPDMHKAVETSGFGREKDFLKFMEAFDLVIMDIKCMDDEMHKRYTRVSNERILQNAGLLCKGNTPFILRIPVIPTVNDNLDNYRAVAKLAAGVKALIRVELLPYHLTAGAKYSMLGKAYQPGFEENKAIHVNLDVFAEYGIRSCVL